MFEKTRRKIKHENETILWFFVQKAQKKARKDFKLFIELLK